MVFTKRLREGIRRGRIRCTIRIWKGLHVKVGGRYPMDEGHVVVDSIAGIGMRDITDDLARESGFSNRADLVEMATHGGGNNVYLIRFHYLAPGAWDRQPGQAAAGDERKTLLRRIRSSPAPTAGRPTRDPHLSMTKARVKAPGKNATSPPSESEMLALLGRAYPAFQALVSRDGKATAEWGPSKQSPWLLKVRQGSRTLFYARPDAGHLLITVLLGGRAVKAALGGSVSMRLHASIRNAKVYPEGRPVSVVVKTPADIASVEELVTVKLKASA